jgi:hypothetical protein
MQVVMLLDSDQLRPLQAVNALRLLLMLPPLPPDSATAAQHRNNMIADLRMFTEHIKQRDITLNVQVDFRLFSS